MKFIFISDTHFGGRNLTGFQMQPRYVEHAREIISAIDRLARQEKVDMVIHGGDVTDNGLPEEIELAASLCKEYLSVPMIVGLGNHDCMQNNCEASWLDLAPMFFPDGRLDTTIIRDGVRTDVLSLHWGHKSREWRSADGQIIHLSEVQYELLRSGEQNLPRVLVMHCQLRPARKEQTGLNNDILIPENNFAAIGDGLISEFDPVLTLSGHIHMNLLDKISNTFAVAVSSAAETPFECKVVEILPEKFSMQTVSLAPELAFTPQYREENRYVQGSESIRHFETVL